MVVVAQAADELLEALPQVPRLAALDLRWNKLGAAHRDGAGISADPRVLAGSQKAPSARVEAAKAAAAKAAALRASGKKVYVPKHVREAMKAQGKT